MGWREHIVRDPEICHGKACIKGTHSIVSVNLARLAKGVTTDALLVSYRSLTRVDISAALAYAKLQEPGVHNRILTCY